MLPRFALRTLAVVLALFFQGCATHPSGGSSTDDAGAKSSTDAATSKTIAEKEPESVGPRLGVIAFVATVYREPRDTSKKLGYLRVGAIVRRAEKPTEGSGCKGDWYGIEPKGFVCVGEDATLDLDHPILKAAGSGPNLKTALPYRYAFVRAVLPLYLRVPSSDEQSKAEFKLKEHLDWFKENEADISKVMFGASDVAIDAQGVPISDKKLGELGLGKNSHELGIGELLGGNSNTDPIPFWLREGKRAVPNISDFKVPESSVFADRARRHTGLALVGSFPTGPESLGRRFAITTDLRLAPATKLKPDTGSPWHGVALTDALTLPLAFVRAQGARAYRISDNRAVTGAELEHRSIHALTGTLRTISGVKYFKTKDGEWLNPGDVGVAVAPSSWPDAAARGEKWVEVSISNQTLVLWEGKKPVYATLVSTGQAGIDDPKRTTATIRGVFRIRNKHITATMDSNEGSSIGGAPERSGRGPSERETPAAEKGSPSPKKEKQGQHTKKGPEASGGSTGGHPAAPKRGDGEYGVTKRRGEGTFQLRDVPYIQYFESGYALHAAYWHDVFGTPRSHGCINLSPVDAHRVFLWTEPQVPEGWHALNAGEDLGEGTVVIVHE